MFYSPNLFLNGTSYSYPGALVDNLNKPAIRRNRGEVQSRWYFVDFGHSTPFPSHDYRRLVSGPLGAYDEVPELAGAVKGISPPTDGFAIDVWCLGRLFMVEFVEVCRIHGGL